MATVALNVKARGGTGDAAPTIRVCDALVAERDPVVVKALSWALRDHVPTLVRREAGNKLESGLKRGR